MARLPHNNFQQTPIKPGAAPLIYFFLFALPAAVWLFWAIRPSYWFNSDPAAWYFLDSLAPFAGQPYQYVDHPGTPVDLIGSLLLGMTAPFFQNQAAFLDYHLRTPELFFHLANLFLLAGSLGSLLFLYRTVTASLKQDKTLAGLALSLTFFAVHPQAFSTLTYWSHNSFNFIFGTLWLTWLYRNLQTGRPARRNLLLLGLTVGAISMIQLYLLAWLAGGLMIILTSTWLTTTSVRHTLTDGLYFLLGGLTGIGLMLLPVLPQLPRLAAWLTRLLGRDGLYGAGEQNPYALELLPASLIFWAQNIPLVIFSLGLIVLIGGILLANRARLPRLSHANRALALGLLLQTALLWLMLSKMFYRLRYTLALAAILPILLLLTITWLEQTNWKTERLTRPLYIGLLLGALFFAGREIADLNLRANLEREAALARSQAVGALAQRLGVTKTDLVVVYAFGTPLQCAGLLAANNWSRAFDAQLSRICPNQYALYDFAFEVNLNTPHPVATLNELKWDLVLWPGNGSSLPETLIALGAVNIPDAWGVKRAKWFFIHPPQP